MEWTYIGMVAFLFVLAAFDLYVGVSNDAVNFLNSAIGSRAAKFRTLVLIASIGVFFGCVLSNGMMDIARHGIFTPKYFSFHDVMYIYMAMMVTDVVLLDIFNTYGMPTSTTVSMVFELLGAAFGFALINMAHAHGAAALLGMADYLNTAKALECIMGIFCSVPIAFIFGSLVQWIVRVIFSFDLRTKLRYKIGIFGGIAITAIIYFMLFKGLKDLSFMSKDVKNFLDQHILIILGCIFVVSAVIMQVLHALRVNVLRVIVLVGTFALATAFAGNDLVNFIGVPLAGFSAFQDFAANGAGQAADSYMMTALMSSSHTEIYFLIAAGAIMVFALATSKKARKVVQTEVGLSRKNEGDEMFGSSRMARSIVRWSSSVANTLHDVVPAKVLRYVDSRFQVPADLPDNGAAYDLLRASVNLTVASLLIALGTSLKLPLSTTFVTFMVAMGSSLADRAWSRESAVFRITGVLSVIGGWFVTACVAFIACLAVAMVMYAGGIWAVIIIVVIGIYSIIHSQRTFARREREAAKEGDVLFQQMLSVEDRTAIFGMLTRHIDMNLASLLKKFSADLVAVTDAFFAQRLRPMRRTIHAMSAGTRDLKNLRRRELICLRRACPPEKAVKVSTDFHLIHNGLLQLLYSLRRITDPAREHVDNHFTPVDPQTAQRYTQLRNRLVNLMNEVSDNLRASRPDDNERLNAEFDAIEADLFRYYEDLSTTLQQPDSNVTTTTLMLHVVRETQQLLHELRDLLKTASDYRRSI